MAWRRQAGCGIALVVGGASAWRLLKDAEEKEAAIALRMAIGMFAIVAPLLAQLLYFACSRQREYLADAGGAVLTRYPEGIMMQRSGAGPIWIPAESVTAIRTERGIAGKALTYDGILAIRWRLPSGTEIDTGFRADNRAEYDRWLEEEA